jgi:hypothetical protein
LVLPALPQKRPDPAGALEIEREVFDDDQRAMVAERAETEKARRPEGGRAVEPWIGYRSNTAATFDD